MVYGSVIITGWLWKLRCPGIEGIGNFCLEENRLSERNRFWAPAFRPGF